MKFKIAWLAMAVVLAPNALADQEENIDKESKVAPDSTISNLIVANNLAMKGVEDKDPLLLITSAKLIKLNSVEQKDREKKSEGGTKSTKQERARYDAQTLLEYAEEWSGDNDAYASLIKQVENLSTRGRIGGNAIHSDRVEAGAVDTYVVPFYGREVAEVAVIGDGDTDIDLHIYDHNGNLICEDTDATDTTYCYWVPRFDGDFIITIKNYGSVYNAYDLLTN
ncbi:hypothetical protein EJ063_00425 [Vibrio aquaticus]|uniref:Peptidase C-terminal archaeal/bacterial domain-containing protein n=1 Tax=Vibrio aquaticus TaxID=2496559 RepID=A0A432D051_9VIBR|nr:hypothetical protein [Vibrio aquaticus]RTZ17281.1 hypothetical protein EJ063_00425 [Vibrio aquaticus]